jgi:SAM-dependent methyltransferase
LSLQKLKSYQGKELEIFKKATNWKNYIASMLSSFLSGTVMEVGAGIGSNINFLDQNDIQEWFLVEPDPGFGDILSNKIRLGELPAKCRVIQGTISSVPGHLLFNTILYIDVIEHIEEHEKEIETAISHLRPGGFLIILAPAHPGLYSEFDKTIGHYRRYTLQQAQSLFPTDKGTFVKACYIDHVGYFLSFLNRWIFRKSSPSINTVQVWDRWLVPVSRKIDKLFGYRYGKSLLLVWQMSNPK